MGWNVEIDGQTVVMNDQQLEDRIYQELWWQMEDCWKSLEANDLDEQDRKLARTQMEECSRMLKMLDYRKKGFNVGPFCIGGAAQVAGIRIISQTVTVS